ncbi:MAG: hypothetical protein Q7K98_07325 [Candidatus Omnitrophota bacterium]|nr:hypothetical protein [Candidatus Omnitrophota bacterium]
MRKRTSKILAIVLSFILIFQQIGFAQVATELNIAGHLSALRNSFVVDKFRPLHLRYLQYLPRENSFKLYLDKGDQFPAVGNTLAVGDTFHQSYKEPLNRKVSPTDSTNLTNATKDLLNYFFIGLTLPNDSFWVNLRPDSPDNIIDDYLAKTDVGKIMLETDLQLKKDTALATSPETPEGRDYWNKLYTKAGELFGSENITIPTLTRPWIVPDEIIIRETTDSAYIYKATLKVMLESDYLSSKSRGHFPSGLSGNSQKESVPYAQYQFKDERLKQLNEYSSQLIRELIIPKLTKEVNSSKRYAPLRQVYYSLILAQWFKARHTPTEGDIFRQGDKGTLKRKVSPDALINSRNLTNLTSQQPWPKATYFQAYQKSFKDGEYNIQEPVYTPTGQVIRSYFSGGENFGNITSPQMIIVPANTPVSPAVKNLIEAPAVSSPLIRIGNQESVQESVDFYKQRLDELKERYRESIIITERNYKRTNDFTKRNASLFLAYYQFIKALTSNLDSGESVYIYPVPGPDFAFQMHADTFALNNEATDNLWGRELLEESGILGKPDYENFDNDIIFQKLLSKGKYLDAYDLKNYFDIKREQDKKFIFVMKGFMYIAQQFISSETERRNFLENLLLHFLKVSDKIIIFEEEDQKFFESLPAINEYYRLLYRDDGIFEGTKNASITKGIIKLVSIPNRIAIYEKTKEPERAIESSGFPLEDNPAAGSPVQRQSVSSAVEEGKQSASSEMSQEQQEIEEINHDFSRFSDYLKRKDFSLYVYNKTRLSYFLKARGIDAFMEVIKYNYNVYPDEIMQRFISGLMNVILSMRYRDLAGQWHGLTKDMLQPHLDFITDIALKPAKRALAYTIDVALTHSPSGKVIMYQNKRLGAVYPIMEKDMQELLREKGFGVFEVDLDNIENKTNDEVVEYINTIMQKSEFSKSRIILVRFKIPSTITYTGLESQKEKLNTLDILSNLSRAPIVMVDGSARNQVSTAQQVVRKSDQGQKIDMFNADISYPYQYFNFDAPDNIDMLLPAISSDDKNGELYDEFAKRMASRLAKDADFWKQIEDRRMRVAKREGGSAGLAIRKTPFAGSRPSQKGEGPEQEKAASLAVGDVKGGIDFRALPIVTEAVSNLRSSLGDSFLRTNSSGIYRKLSPADEWQEIERMASSGITPSPERMKEYLQASCAKGDIPQDKDKVILCIADILRGEEETCFATDPTLRDILVVLEASGSSTELNKIFLG